MIHGDPTYPIPTGDTMMEFSTMMYEEPEKIHQGTQERVAFAKKLCDEMAKHPGLWMAGACAPTTASTSTPSTAGICSLSSCSPISRRSWDYYRAAGYYSIKHTDGNVMPILDMIVDAGPDAVHSLDPQGGVSLTKAKELYGDRVCLIGNVNCGLMQTGTEEQLVEDVRRSSGRVCRATATSSPPPTVPSPDLPSAVMS